MQEIGDIKYFAHWYAQTFWNDWVIRPKSQINHQKTRSKWSPRLRYEEIALGSANSLRWF